MLLSVALAATLADPSGAPAATAPDEDARAEIPDLERVRYRDPTGKREIWLGAELGGIALPQSLGLFSRRVWTVHGAPAWSVALLPWLAIGGRHAVVLYDAVNIRLRAHDHQLELSARTLALRSRPRRFVDRVSIGVSTHAIKKTRVDGLEFKPGGLNDIIVYAGYGLSHDLGRRWRLDWQVQGRWAWVFLDTQRHVRAAVRGSVYLGRQHRLAGELVGFYVNRDETQAGNPLPRNAVYGQMSGEYTWMSRVGVGPLLRMRLLSSFRSGEAPAYEIREEALNATYGEVIVGVRGIWR